MLEAVISLSILLADTAAPPPDPGEPPQGGGLQMLIMFGAIFLIMWLFVLRPQKQKESDEKQMLERIKKNDHVLTKSGMYGVVMNVKDDEVTLRVDEQQNVKLRFQKSAIASILADGEKTKTEEKKA